MKANIRREIKQEGRRTKDEGGRNRKLFRALVWVLALSLWASLTWGDAGFKQALGVREWSFPVDYGSHPEYRTEWWYFTGNLTDKAGRPFGYQLTFFRQALRQNSAVPQNPWSVRDVHLAHFALTDKERKDFWYTDQATRTGPGLAHAKQGTMDVRNLKWSARMKGGKILIYASHKGMTLDLTLSPAKPTVLHGKRGLSMKGPNPGQASYYLSMTRLETTGTIRTPKDDQPVPVTGTSWFDQEFGSNQLSKEQAGWDWFGIHLSDGRDVMVYVLRNKDGTIEGASSGTLIERDGTARHLKLSEIILEVGSTWKSPRTKALYPAQWRIRVPAEQVDFTATPLVADQELVTSSSTGITYWEGAIQGKGLSKGRPVSIEGYAELTGYAGSLGGIF